MPIFFTEALTPRDYAHYTFGSGDADPFDGRPGEFDDLFPGAHLRCGCNDLGEQPNLKNIRLGAQPSPHQKRKISFDNHGFRLASGNDGLPAGRTKFHTPWGSKRNSQSRTEP